MGNYDGSVKIDSKLDLNGLKKAVGELKQVISDAVSGIQAEAGGNRRSGEERGAGGCQRREGGKGRLCRSRAGRRAGRQKVRTAASAFNMDEAREQLPAAGRAACADE